MSTQQQDSSSDQCRCRKLHMELPLGLKFRPNDQEIVLYYLLNKVQGNPILEDSMNVIVDCDVFGDPSAWMKIFQETHMDRLYFYTKLKKKNKHIERSTHSATWRSQKDQELYDDSKTIHYGSKRSFSFVAKNGFNGTGRWTMNEYRLDGEFANTANHDNYVICCISKKENI
ncbi:NAC domain containing protein 50-like [Quercus lobata]|uniref:NAC domain-containing protein n=1 Tax=Quercus lobata TaxID=97700 RepID=A0A7N2KXP5_QUELO|nr:NAC domain containing protein 50-like [Quercus lobata]